MVRINELAVALAVGSAAAVPRFNLPSLTLPALTDLAFLESFTLPAYGGASSTTTSPTALPGYGGASSSSSVASSSSKSTSSEATKPTSSIIPSGGASKPASSIVPTETATTKISGLPSSGTFATVTRTGAVPVGSGASASPSVSSPVSGGSSPSKTPVSVGSVTGSSSRSVLTETVVPVPVTGPVTSIIYPTGTAPASSGVVSVGTSKSSRSSKVKACTSKSKSIGSTGSPVSSVRPVTSGRPASSGLPASSGRSVSSGRPLSSGRPIASSAASGTGRSKPPSTSTTGSSAQPTVSTTSGNVVGHPAPNTTNGVWEYLGIKFGQTPVGDLRFAPPVAYTGTGLINGSTWGDDCACTNLNVPQGLDPRLSGLFNSLAQTNISLSEDCLYLNVWAKGNAVNKPVLVWIYGGGFNFGGSHSSTYNGRHFADDEDVIFVSFNYRTNVMGFSGAPGITQNVGLLDQRLAIEWIRDNIAAFGGDASRITIFGQSAGGASVDLYTFAYYDDPIIAGAIPMSGSSNSFGSRTTDQALVNWDNATTSLGCGNSSNTPAETVLSCMRQPNITWQAIQDVSKAKPGLNSLLGGFGPTVDNTVVFSNYTERVLDGYVAKVPVLTGNDNYESGLLSLIAIAAGESYPQSTWDYIDLQVFTCPISRIARYRGDIGVPSWRYYYSGAWPNLVLPTANLTQAWHTSEIPVLFGTAEEITVTPNTANETALGDYLRGVWADFAADPLVLDGEKYGWPRYVSGQMINLGLNNASVPSFSNASAIEGGCTF